MRYLLFVSVTSLQASGAEGLIPSALSGALEVAVVYCDEQVMSLLLGDRPVNDALGKPGEEAAPFCAVEAG